MPKLLFIALISEFDKFGTMTDRLGVIIYLSWMVFEFQRPMFDRFTFGDCVFERLGLSVILIKVYDIWSTQNWMPDEYMGI